jgi:hypothetical protein
MIVNRRKPSRSTNRRKPSRSTKRRKPSRSTKRRKPSRPQNKLDGMNLFRGFSLAWFNDFYSNWFANAKYYEWYKKYGKYFITFLVSVVICYLLYTHYLINDITFINDTTEINNLLMNHIGKSPDICVTSVNAETLDWFKQLRDTTSDKENDKIVYILNAVRTEQTTVSMMDKIMIKYSGCKLVILQDINKFPGFPNGIGGRNPLTWFNKTFTEIKLRRDKKDSVVVFLNGTKYDYQYHLHSSNNDKSSLFEEFVKTSCIPITDNTIAYDIPLTGDPLFYYKMITEMVLSNTGISRN